MSLKRPNFQLNPAPGQIAVSRKSSLLASNAAAAHDFEGHSFIHISSNRGIYENLRAESDDSNN